SPLHIHFSSRTLCRRPVEIAHGSEPTATVVVESQEDGHPPRQRCQRFGRPRGALIVIADRAADPVELAQDSEHVAPATQPEVLPDRKSTRLNSSHFNI